LIGSLAFLVQELWPKNNLINQSPEQTAWLVTFTVVPLYLCACFYCPPVHASNLHPLLAHHYVDVYCLCTI